MNSLKSSERTLCNEEKTDQSKAIENIREKEEKWTGGKLKQKLTDNSVETFMQEIQELTEKIHKQTTQEDYESILAYVEGKYIYKKNKVDILGAVLKQAVPVMAIFFTVLLYFLREYLENSVFTGNWILFICLVLLCLIAAIGGKVWQDAQDRKLTFYELLHKSLERRTAAP